VSKKKKFKIRSEEGATDMGLQITSMADIFTIILVFLLKSISGGATLEPTAEMNLPNVEVPDKDSIRDTVKIEISKNAVLVDTKPVMTLYNFLIDSRAPASAVVTEGLGANANLAAQAGVSQSVLKALMEHRTKGGAGENGNTRIVVMADEETPYSTLKAMMNTAAVAGYVDMQLIVVGGEQ
jgi:biopolymer transport protein ExbD